MMTRACSAWNAGRRRGILLLAITSMVVLCMGQQCADYKELGVRSAQIVNTVAPNTEALGDPVGLTLASGSFFAAAGVGLVDAQPGTIQIDIPMSDTVKQVILYWEGQAATETEQGDTDSITLNGTIAVEGVRIGGPTGFLPDFWTSTYRADITALDLIEPGVSSFTVEGLDFGQRNNGAGILVVVDDGVTKSSLQLKDGNDFAFFQYAPPLNTTEPVTFTFPASDEQRFAALDLFVSSVALEDPSGAFGRPTIIRIWLDDVLTTELVDVLDNSDGNEWDTFSTEGFIPAGVTSLTIQVLSEDAGTGPFAGHLPASLTWSTAAFALEQPEEEEGNEGCTPGYWKQEQHFGNWTAPYTPSTLFSSVFEDAFPGLTLLQVLQQGGGGLNALGRQTVAALLNAASPDVNFGVTPQEVIDAFNAVFPGTKDAYEDLKDEFEELNARECPLGRAELDGDADGDNTTPVNGNGNNNGKGPKK